MHVESLKISNYRNIEALELKPEKGINVIYGENAQGKTNLLESIWLFSGFRSFRGSKDGELIRFGTDNLRLDMDFYGGGREQNAKIIIAAAQKKILLNAVPLTASSRLVGNFGCVVFSPAYLALIKGAPSERRRFTDAALCQIKPSYAKALTEYNKTLIQRNSFIKNLKYSGRGEEFLDIWNEKLADAGAIIVRERIDYLNIMAKAASEIYSGLSGKKEKLTLSYNLRISPNKYKRTDEPPGKERLIELINGARNSDMLRGSTNIGAHRDEIDIKIDGVSAKSYGSQGQQRSAALSLKLGEAEILKELTGERPVALLDDVMSELDVNRQDYILNHIKDWQVFITCCDPETVLRLYSGKTFRIKKGRLVG